MARIMLVDDEVGVRKALTLHFDTRDEIIYAATAAESLEILQRQPVVDLVILEYRLPDLSGLELLARIKARLPRLPVIMITAYGSEWVCASALKLGARDYFVKPFDPADLVASIRSILSTATRQNESRRNVLVHHKHVAGVVSPQPTYQPRPIDWAALAVRQAVRFIQEHYWETISLPQVGRHVGMSPFALSRKFKAAVNVSFRNYLLQCRVMKARDLLRMSQYSVTEIAQMVGFGDLPRFDKVFKQLVGVPPSTYRTFPSDRTSKDKDLARNY